jgi:hypothetical protein
MKQPTSLEFLQAVYLNEELPLSVRMRAAIEAAPYEQPKLSAIGFVRDADTFASRLERATQRSKTVMHQPLAIEDQRWRNAGDSDPRE